MIDAVSWIISCDLNSDNAKHRQQIATNDKSYKQKVGHLTKLAELKVSD